MLLCMQLLLAHRMLYTLMHLVCLPLSRLGRGRASVCGACTGGATRRAINSGSSMVLRYTLQGHRSLQPSHGVPLVASIESMRPQLATLLMLLRTNKQASKPGHFHGLGCGASSNACLNPAGLLRTCFCSWQCWRVCLPASTALWTQRPRTTSSCPSSASASRRGGRTTPPP